jgi:hypothetical protein
VRLSNVFLIVGLLFTCKVAIYLWLKTPCQPWAETKSQKCDSVQISCDRSVKFCSKLIAVNVDYK